MMFDSPYCGWYPDVLTERGYMQQLADERAAEEEERLELLERLLHSDRQLRSRKNLIEVELDMDDDYYD